MQSGRNLPVFQKTELPLSSGLETGSSSEMVVNV